MTSSGADGYREFVTDQWPVFLRTARLLAADHQGGEDLLQGALVKLWFAWPKIRDHAPTAYLRTILVRDASRARRRRWAGERPTADMPERLGPDPTESTAERLVLLAALAELSPRQRAVVVLRYVEDLPEAAVAEALGCSTGAVKTHASRGLTRLRSIWSTNNTPQPERQR